MKRYLQFMAAVSIGAGRCNVVDAADPEGVVVGSRQLSDDAGCRCEYPGEDIYRDLDASLTEIGIESHRTIDGVTVLPSFHEACEGVWFVCPGTELNGSPWSYACAAEDQGRRNIRGRRGLSKSEYYQRDGQSARPYYTKEGVSTNHFPDEFHHLVDERDQPSEKVYVELDRNAQYCQNGGTQIQSGEPIHGCVEKHLDFQQAGDRRPMTGGMYVADDWFLTHGVKVKAQSQGGPNNLHPMIFDTRNPEKNGMDVSGHFPERYYIDCDDEESSKCDVELNNILVASTKEGVDVEVSGAGILMFSFYPEATIESITLLNADERSKVMITQADMAFSVLSFSSTGTNEVQSVPLQLENVIRLAVSFRSFGGVVSMDHCIP